MISWIRFVEHSLNLLEIIKSYVIIKKLGRRFDIIWQPALA